MYMILPIDPITSSPSSFKGILFTNSYLTFFVGSSTEIVVVPANEDRSLLEEHDAINSIAMITINIFFMRLVIIQSCCSPSTYVRG